MSRLDKWHLHELFFYLRLTRRLEAEITALHHESRIPGPVAFAIGREALSISAAYPLGTEDYLSSAVPSVGAWLVRGAKPYEILAHFMGRESGPTRGRSGSSDFGSLEMGLVAPGGHIAMHVSVMAGVAMGARYLGKTAVAVAVVSEKAVATGDFHEGLNLAAVHNLPLVVVIDNDPTSYAASLLGTESLYERIAGYGVPALPVDGVDILQVLQVMETAVARGRNGRGPTLIDVRTHREAQRAPGEDSIPAPFEEAVGRLNEGREAGEEDQEAEGASTSQEPHRKTTDPVEYFESFLVDHSLMEPVERGLIVDRVERVIDGALHAMEEDDFPRADTLRAGVYQSPAADEIGSDGTSG